MWQLQAVFPSRALNIYDTRNLPDYGLFREIKVAAAAEEAAMAEAQYRYGYCGKMVPFRTLLGENDDEI